MNQVKEKGGLILEAVFHKFRTSTVGGMKNYLTVMARIWYLDGTMPFSHGRL